MILNGNGAPSEATLVSVSAESRPTPVVEQPLRAASTTSLRPTNINFSDIIPTPKRFTHITTNTGNTRKRKVAHAVVIMQSPYNNEFETASRPNMLGKKKALDDNSRRKCKGIKPSKDKDSKSVSK